MAIDYKSPGNLLAVMKRIDLLTLLFVLALWVLPILPAQASAIPDKAYISGVVGHPQSYSLSCESRSAADWAAFWGVNITEQEFLDALPRSDNPNKGFVGYPDDAWGYTPPNSYGVHAAPVARVLRRYGLDAHAGQGLSWEEIRAEVAAGRPVIVWVIGSIWSGNAKEFTAPDGEKVIVAAFEHTMILIGYDEVQVHLVDAFTGLAVSHPIQNFLESWGILGNMAVVGRGTSDAEQTSALQKASEERTYTVQPGDTLGTLAVRWGLSWQEITAYNQIAYPYTIIPGQVLSYVRSSNPASSEESPVFEGAVYVVQPGEHLMLIAQKLEIDWELLAETNGLAAPYLLYPGDLLQLPIEQVQTPETDNAAEADLPTTYTATSYENLYALAFRFNVDWARLAAINNLSFPYMISPGQTILLK